MLEISLTQAEGCEGRLCVRRQVHFEGRRGRRRRPHSSASHRRGAGGWHRLREGTGRRWGCVVHVACCMWCIIIAPRHCRQRFVLRRHCRHTRNMLRYTITQNCRLGRRGAAARRGRGSGRGADCARRRKHTQCHPPGGVGNRSRRMHHVSSLSLPPQNNSCGPFYSASPAWSHGQRSSMHTLQNG